ncbi:MAG TPA: SDR family NAD(P)-dependent oxidoreductase, partial [Anseongella sp.]|nr:SDR family NAD(P)-dependent oxidoreductase [Anseongella sp.]
MSDFNLTGKVAIVTGGASGIGLAISRTFARKGAQVYIFEMNQEQAGRTADEIRAGGGKAVAIACDVSSQEQVKQQVEAILEKHPVDILVNNAGIAHVGKLEGTTEADFDRIYRVNVKGMYNCMLAVVGSMKANGGGVILNMASVAASVGIPDRFAYSMSKGAARTMTFSVAKDYISDGIRCNCISPGRVHTPFVDGFLAKNYPGKEQEM